MRWQLLVTVVRDAMFLVVGFGGVIWQQVTGDVNPWLLAVYTTMLGIPGAIGLLQLGRGTGRAAPPSTASPPSASPPPPSSSSS